MEEELKEIIRSLLGYLKKRRLKIIGWIIFILGIFWIIGGFFTPITFLWGIPLTIVGGYILKKELKKLASASSPYFGSVARAGPTLLVLGIIFIVLSLIFFIPLYGWGILLVILGIPLATARLVLKHHIIGDWGYVIDRLYITINGKRVTSNRLNVSANITEDFSNVDPKKAPKIEFDNINYNFGEVTEGETVVHKFKFKNTGKSDLIIRKVKSSCGCTATLVGDKIIKKGKGSYIEAKFNTQGRGGKKQYKTITVITNDPERPQIILKLHGFVKKKENKKETPKAPIKKKQ